MYVEDARTVVSVVVSSGSVAFVAAVAGAPLALIRRSSRSSCSRFVFDAVTSGLLTVLVAVTVWTWLGWTGLGAVVVGVAAVVGVTVRRHGLGDLSGLRPRARPWTIVAGVLVAAAAAFRLRSVNFIAATGDHGGYVNWANNLARRPVDLATGWTDGTAVASFPPLLPVFMSLPARVFGPIHTTSALPLAGLLLLAGVLRVLGQLDAHVATRIAAVILVGWHVHAIWYSSFPLSEALQAPLVVILLSCCLDVWRHDGDELPVGELLAVAVTAAALGFNRGTAPLFLVPFLVLLAASWAPSWRRFTPGIARSTAATLAGLSLAHLYSVNEIRPYYVGNQIGGILGDGPVEALDRLGLLRPSVVAVVGSAAVIVALAWLARRIEQRATDEPPTVGGASWPWPFTAVLAVLGAVVLLVATTEEIWAQVDRIGWALAAAAALGLVLPRAGRGERGLAAVFVTVLALLMVVVQISRLDEALIHTHFLYWDRYLFSEYFPAVVLLAALGASAAIEWAQERRSARDRPGTGRLVPALVPALVATPVALAVVAAGVAGPTISRMGQETTQSNAIQFMVGIDALLGEPSTPVLWSSTTGGPPARFGYPNTWHAFGVPLGLTFGHRLVNVPRPGDSFEPDQVVTPAAMAAVAACQPDGRVLVVEVDPGAGTALTDRVESDDGLEVRRLGDEAVVIPRLAQPPTRGWSYSEVRAIVYEASGSVEASVDCADLRREVLELGG